jgi:hypothetical protein
VVLRLTNHTATTLPFDVRRLALARLQRPGTPGYVEPVVPEPTRSATDLYPESHLGETAAEIAASGVVTLGAARAGVIIVPRIGRQLADASIEVVTAAAITAVVLPIEVVLFIDRKLKEPPSRLDPGQTVRFAVDLGALPISEPADYALLLGSALGLQPGAVTVAMTEPGAEHSGYRPPSEHQSLGFRFGGGGVHLPGPDGWTTEAQVYTGWKVMGVLVGPLVSVPVLSFSAGLQASLPWQVGKRARIDPSIGYEWRNLFHSDLGWTHGPVLGADLAWYLENHRAMGYPVKTSRIGMFVRGGPSFHDGDVGALWQAGLAYVY